MYKVHFLVTATDVPRRELQKLFEELPFRVVDNPSNGAVNVAIELSVSWEEFQDTVIRVKKSKSL